ncbi:MAG: TRAM domain-containing protein [Gemmatimonadota bacterium]
MIAVGDHAEVVVRGVAAGGAGVGDLEDGRVVFVHRTAPGDRARVRITKSKSRWARGELEQLLEPGLVRAEAACPSFVRCGGCQLQHLAYEEQLRWKGRFVSDALGRIGGVEWFDGIEVVPAPEAVGYRSRVAFSFRRLPGGRVVAGFHEVNRPTRVVDISSECVLPEPEVMAAWRALRDGWGDGARHLPPSARLRLTLRAASAGVELTVSGGREGWNAQPLAQAVPVLSAIWHAPKQGPVVLAAGVESPGGGTAFEQVNRSAASMLRDDVVEWIGRPSETGSRLVDAYCGTGDLGRAAAMAGWVVMGIESSAEAVRMASAEAPEGFTAVRAAVEQRLADAWEADTLVLNPPRTGLDSTVPGQILRAGPRRIVYVSCDPATLSRDVAVLTSAYQVASVRAYDLFPQTAHVETVLTLQKQGETS